MHLAPLCASCRTHIPKVWWHKVTLSAHNAGTMHSTRVLGVLLLVLIAASPAVAVDWGSLTQETLAALPVSDFQSATSGDIAVIPPSACAGFDAAQLAALSSTAIDGMSTCGCVLCAHWAVLLAQ